MYRATESLIWTGRIDRDEGDLGHRWHQRIKIIDLSRETLPIKEQNKRAFALIGFECDEGVRRNKGRTGAKDGPNAIRRACSNLADHFNEEDEIVDLGNISCEGQDLEDAQQKLSQCIFETRKAGYFPVVLGGGHEVAYPHFLGLKKAIAPESKLGIINIDAHFDLRQPKDGPSSGTPFFQINQLCISQGQEFPYFCVGIQSASNTKALFERASELQVEYISAQQCHQVQTFSHNLERISSFITSVEKIYLTICLDAFDVSVAPGVSAPSAFGLFPAEVLPFLEKIIESGKMISFDVAELNPSLDEDRRTAMLAAKLIHFITEQYSQ